ncbi:hypothetical protein PPERSA_12677 [Pseudocohnilembus persalinus]|uniref:Uncharacterized protein n=1 Tax=Pseudocohnilembus persalinus TaxID=266149 RepID=A0A0V0QMQ0_PSEPJ|nr:hypothetical protein PPERSA_12677 [Pseudocohnilembus persalinus]|eukprot:KRX03547.1 hypothetical protein PPERSA_12677 [Pseudocohnilembus persalinus]
MLNTQNILILQINQIFKFYNRPFENNNQKKEKQGMSMTEAFKQQVMKAWQPVPTVNSTIILFSVFTLFFIVFGIILLAYSLDIKEYSVQYNDELDLKEFQEKSSDYVSDDYQQLTIEIKEDMKAPVYVYYELQNFYQNNRRYVKSKNSDQLKGEKVGKGAASDDCDPIVTNSDVGRTISYTGVPLDPDAVANPCGMIAKSYFTDEYMLRKSDTSFDINGEIDGYFKISAKDIAWPSDKEHKYANSENSESEQWMDYDNERFMVWMRTAALPKFRKIWGKINEDIPAGTYTIDILNVYDVEPFDGKKTLIFSTSNAFGGKNLFLAIAYLIAGGLSLIVTVAFLVKKFAHKKQKPQ